MSTSVCMTPNAYLDLKERKNCPLQILKYFRSSLSHSLCDPSSLVLQLSLSSLLSFFVNLSIFLLAPSLYLMTLLLHPYIFLSVLLAPALFLSGPSFSISLSQRFLSTMHTNIILPTILSLSIINVNVYFLGGHWLSISRTTSTTFSTFQKWVKGVAVHFLFQPR